LDWIAKPVSCGAFAHVSYGSTPAVPGAKRKVRVSPKRLFRCRRAPRLGVTAATRTDYADRAFGYVEWHSERRSRFGPVLALRVKFRRIGLRQHRPRHRSERLLQFPCAGGTSAALRIRCNRTVGARIRVSDQMYIGARYRLTHIEGITDKIGIQYDPIEFHTVSAIVGFYLF
jgi:hypothetical protein